MVFFVLNERTRLFIDVSKYVSLWINRWSIYRYDKFCDGIMVNFKFKL